MDRQNAGGLPGRILAVLLVVPSIAAAQSTDPGTYVLIARDSIRVKRLSTPDGSVAVIGARGVFASKNPLDAHGGAIAAPVVRLGGPAVCDALFGNDVRGATPSCGPAQPFDAPFADLPETCGFPPSFPACNPSLPATIVPAGPAVQLPPGTYGDLKVEGGAGGGARVVLSGEYRFCNVAASRGARIDFAGPSQVYVNGALTTSNAVDVGPANGSALAAEDVQLFVAGDRVRVSRGGALEAHVCAPRARLNATGASLTGRFVAHAIRAKNVTSTLSPNPNTTTTTTTVSSSTTSTPTTSSTTTTGPGACVCGDGIVNGGSGCGEACDGDISCGGAFLGGVGSGDSACAAFGVDCSLDCAPDCKSFTTQPCPGATTTTVTTPSTTTSTPTSTTSTTTTTGPTPCVCGDGIVNAGEGCGEACDGDVHCGGGPIENPNPDDSACPVFGLDCAADCAADCRSYTSSPCGAFGSTTTTSLVTSSTTSTTLIPSLRPVEICGNCLDDDGDGAVDFEDSDCCASAQTFAAKLKRSRIRTRSTGNRMRLRSTLATQGLHVDPSVDEVSLLVRSPDGTLLCARIPPGSFGKAKRGWRFKDKTRSVTDARGIDNVRIKLLKNGAIRYRATGKRVQLDGAPAAGSLQVTVGFRDTRAEGTANRCSVATKTFRSIKKGGVRYP